MCDAEVREILADRRSLAVPEPEAVWTVWGMHYYQRCIHVMRSKVKLMQPCGPAVSFSWPKNDDMLGSTCTCVMLCSDPTNNKK